MRGWITLAAVLVAAPAFAAGSGAGAGGAGHQRAINSGLPVGEPGPSGAPNNRRATLVDDGKDRAAREKTR